MSVFSKKQIAEHASLNASLACSACEHVWPGGLSVAAVAHMPEHFVVGCSEDCLLSQNRTVVRADHLYGRDDNFLPLLHLPLYGKACQKRDGWELGIFESVSPDVILGDSFFIQQCLNDERSRSEVCFALFVRNRLHFETLYRGARVVPIWRSFGDAETYRNGLNFISRAMLGTRKVTYSKICEICRRDSQNYLVISHTPTKREALIVDPVLNLSKNTMQL